MSRRSPEQFSSCEVAFFPSRERRPIGRLLLWLRDTPSLLEDGILPDELRLAPLVAKAKETAGPDVGDTH